MKRSDFLKSLVAIVAAPAVLLKEKSPKTTVWQVCSTSVKTGQTDYTGLGFCYTGSQETKVGDLVMTDMGSIAIIASAFQMIGKHKWLHIRSVNGKPLAYKDIQKIKVFSKACPENAKRA
jgi:hypothetical protein